MTNRSVSGLILKNSIRLTWVQLPEALQNYVKRTTLSAISDPQPLIRATVGIIITTIVIFGGFAQWPELIPTLCTLLDDTSVDTQEVSHFILDCVLDS